MKDYRLFIFVGILLAIDTVLLSAWQIVDPLKIFKNISQKQVEKKKLFRLKYFHFVSIQTKDEDIVILWIYEECRSNHRSIWITMQSIYKGVLMVRRYFYTRIYFFFLIERNSISIILFFFFSFK